MRTTLILLGALLVLCSGAASAQTPDDPSPSPVLAPACAMMSWAVYGLGDAHWAGTVQTLPVEDFQGAHGTAAGPRGELPPPIEQACTCSNGNPNCGNCNHPRACSECCTRGLSC